MHVIANTCSSSRSDRIHRMLPAPSHRRSRRFVLPVLSCLVAGLAFCASPASARSSHSVSARALPDEGPRPLQLSDLPPELRALANASGETSPGDGRVVDRGVASWYGGRHNGRRTASGTRFDQRELTAAHAFLPLGTRVRVVREDTGEAVVVTITDRIGTHRRVIDLSRSAAVALNMIGPGVARVRIEVLEG